MYTQDDVNEYVVKHLYPAFERELQTLRAAGEAAAEAHANELRAKDDAHSVPERELTDLKAMSAAAAEAHATELRAKDEALSAIEQELTVVRAASAAAEMHAFEPRAKNDTLSACEQEQELARIRENSAENRDVQKSYEETKREVDYVRAILKANPHWVMPDWALRAVARAGDLARAGDS
jgi:hypothetical protein